MPIDATKPEAGQATTQSVRDNMQAIIDEFIRVDAVDAVQDADIDAAEAAIIVNAGAISDNSDRLDIVEPIADQNALDIITNAGNISTNAGDIGDNDTELLDHENRITTLENAPPLGGFPAGTLMLFQQTAAPVDWTKQVTHNDKALRVVSGAAGTGGVDAFTSTFGVGKVSGSHTLTIAQMPSHNHTVQVRSGSTGGTPGVERQAQNASTNNNARILFTGGGGGHTHTLANFDLQFVDIIIASKD